MQEINLFDVLDFYEIDDDKIILEVFGKFAVANNNDNIVYKTAEILKKRFGIKKGVKICLEKNIPFGAGLGGGSSDSANALKALVKLWNIKISDQEMNEIASLLGSDVPFFLDGGKAFVEGRGEIITKISNYKNFDIVLVYPNLNISTKEIYGRLNLGLTKDSKKCSITHLIEQSFEGHFFNKFEEVVFEIAPEVKQIRNELLALGASTALMSGSGSCVFGVFSSNDIAKKTKEHLQASHQKYSIWNLNTL